MVKNKKKTLKVLKEETELCFEKDKYDEALSLCEEIKKNYPKNVYGYINYLKAITKNYSSYISYEQIKELKKIYEKAYELSKDSDKDNLKQTFEDYLDDCNEVENLRKVKKELTSKYLLKTMYNDEIAYINQNITTVKSYDLNGKRIVNFYDFIKGVFLLFCLIFNLIFTNYLLILTIPFGIVGIITIYMFIKSNFLGGKMLKSEKKYVTEIVEQSELKIADIKNEIKKTEDNIIFLDSLKRETILKIPETFLENLKELLNDNEFDISKKIYDELLNNNISSFTYLLSENTLLQPEDIIEKLRADNDNKLVKFIENKNKQKNKNKNNFILMKPVAPFNYFMIFILIIISFFSVVIIIKNFYEINLISFLAAIITGIISVLTYNIYSGKHTSLVDVFNNNLLSTIFNTTLVYNLIYESIFKKLSFTYGFIQMPIIFILIFIGFIALISLLKYKNLIKKLRG